MGIRRIALIALLLICYHSNSIVVVNASVKRHLQSVGEVKNFRLINADTNVPIVNLKNGMIINIATLSSEHLNVQATTTTATNGTVVMIRFGYNGNSNFRNESLRPFSFCGDGLPIGNYYVCNELGVGNHTISANPYSISGEVGVTKEVTFSITDFNQAQNDATPSDGNTPVKSPTSGTSGSCNIAKVRKNCTNLKIYTFYFNTDLKFCISSSLNHRNGNYFHQFTR